MSSGYVVKMGLALAAIVVAGGLGILIFGNVWARTGIGAAMFVLVGGVLLFGWSYDRKEKAKRAGLEDLPNV
jgi:Flp pilus assembly protein TadB